MSFVRTNDGWGTQDVPYVIDNASFTASQRRTIEVAIRAWNRQAPTRLVRRTNQRDHLFFRRHNSECASWVGRQGGRQEVLCAVGSPFRAGHVMHEIGHSLGLLHEHQRPDRDDFLVVTANNRNLDIQSGHFVAAVGKYDLSSIMHYPPSGNVRVRGSTTADVGQRSRLTAGDIRGLLWLRRGWQREPGKLSLISVSQDSSTLWGVNGRDEIFRKNLADVKWTKVGGRLRYVSAGPGELVWGVNSGGEIFHLNGANKWDKVSGSLRTISVGRDRSTWGTNAKQQIFRRSANQWQSIPGKLVMVSVGTSGQVWGVNSAQQIFRRHGQGWQRVSGKLRWVSVGSDGTVWGVNANHQIFMRDGADNWTRVSGSLAMLDVSDFANVYGVNHNGQIFSYRE